MFTFFFQVSWLLNNLNVYFRTTSTPPQHCRCCCTHIYKLPELHITLLCPNMSLRTNECISILGKNTTGCRFFAQCVVRCSLCRNSSWLKELFILSLALKGGLRYSTQCSKFLSQGHVYDLEWVYQVTYAFSFLFFFLICFAQAWMEYPVLMFYPSKEYSKPFITRTLIPTFFYWSPFLPL